MYGYMYKLTMQWLEESFLGFIDSWEQEVKNSNRPAQERRKMMLSNETIEGIRITGTGYIKGQCFFILRFVSP